MCATFRLHPWTKMNTFARNFIISIGIIIRMVCFNFTPSKWIVRFEKIFPIGMLLFAISCISWSMPCLHLCLLFLTSVHISFVIHCEVVGKGSYQCVTIKTIKNNEMGRGVDISLNERAWSCMVYSKELQL